VPKQVQHPKSNKRITPKNTWPTIRFLHANQVYEVDGGKRLDGNKKYRKWFKTLEDAKQHAEQLKIKLKNEGLSSFKLTREQLIDAEKGLKILDGNASITQACEFFAKFHREKRPDLTFNSLIDEFMEHKERQSALGERGASESTLQDYKYRLGSLSDQYGESMVLSFKEEEYLDWLRVRGDIRGMMRTTKALLTYAVDKDYLPENPLKSKIPKAKIDTPTVLQDNQWRSLVLSALSTQDHKNSDKGQPIDLLACVVLGLWCGLRPEAELRRLDWSDINIEEGFVNIHDHWKVAMGRLVTIPDCAKGLLDLCINKQGPVVNPKNFRRRWEWLRKSADVFDSWDSDIMRHTYASMHYGYYMNKQKIINELGHCNQSMLRHYVNHGAKMKKRAKEFFSFTAPLPDQIGEAVKSA
jgi:integrase